MQKIQGNMRFHLIAIGGAVMHNLALALQAAGHQVTGSDDEIYEPSLGRLRAAGLLPPKMGWDVNRVTEDIDCVILGKHAREDNPELQRAIDLEIEIKSFPEFIYEMSKDKKRIVIGGSHGKTTTTSMVMHACRFHNIDIDYLVGAQLESFNNMVKLSDAEIIVIEGDEYPSSAIDDRPKFLHYKPHLAVLTGIAWDHINVFPVYDDYVDQFRKFIESIESGGTLFYDESDEELQTVASGTTNEITAVGYRQIPHRQSENGTVLLGPDGEEYPISIFGAFNMANLAAAQGICGEIGISEDDFMVSMSTFKGASKRQQILGEKNGRIVYLDFAHAPSKVNAATRAMVERYGLENILACLELHTFSSLNKKFLDQYRGALNGIHSAMVFYSPHTIEMKRLEPIEPDDVVEAFDMPELHIGHEASDLEKFISERQRDKKVLLLMSSGKFGGLDLQKITTEFLEIE